MFTLIVAIVLALCAITLYACVCAGAEADRQSEEYRRKKRLENLKK